MKSKRILIPIAILIQSIFCIACASRFSVLDLNQIIEQGTKVRADPAKDNYYLDFTGNMECKPEVLYLYNEEVYPNHIWARIPSFKEDFTFYFSIDKKYINNTYVSFECKSKSYGIHMAELMAYNKSLKDAP